MKKLFFAILLVLLVNAGFSQARIQVIHNSADAALETVDIWLDETLLLDNFSFRTASAFTDAVPGNVSIVVAEADSQNPDNPLWSGNVELTDNETYVIVAEGMISQTGYNPYVPFDLAVYSGAREIATSEEMTDMITHHGSTDAPDLDINEIAIGLGTIVDNIGYSEFDGYLELATKDFMFDVTEAAGSPLIDTYTAYFRILGFKGMAITVLTSGFLDPAGNSNGPAFGLWVATAAGGDLIELPPYNPTARVQIIHNSADAAASTVDVWMNDTRIADDLAFRTATPFLDLNAEEEITITVCEAGSENPSDPLWSGNYTLTVNEKYILVADGIISPSGYDPAPPFDLELFPQAREVAFFPDNTDVLIHHGSTDAPIVDIYEVGTGAGLLADNLAYTGFAGYLELEPLDYIIEIRDESGTNKIVAYELPLETIGLDGFAISLIASGFLYPENNSNGPAFGLWMATAEGGNLIKLTVYDPKARLQFIHNSADNAAEMVDIWMNETLLVDNLEFRTASAFLDVPALQELTITVAGPDSQSPDDPVWANTYNFEKDKSYLFVADGIVSQSGYEPAVPFDMLVYPNAREEASSGGQTDMLIHHGSTDAPTVDLVEVGIGLGVMVDNLSYGEFAGYFGLATVNYIIQVRDETGMTKIAAYSVPLGNMGLQGEAVTVVASGFLVPDNNSGGPEFGLYLAKASGGDLIKLPLYDPKARIQIIHNSADTMAEIVDVWLNQTLLLDNFAFRTASAFMDAPANEQFTISIKGPESVDPYNPLFARNYTLIEGETYLLVADGIISESGYDPDQPFDIKMYGFAREESVQTGYTDILVHHGATDAPVVDIIEVGLGAGLIVNDLAYGNFSNYLELPAINYILEVRNASNSALLGTFRAPLETLGLENEAITVVASGFVVPGNNSDGPAFGLWLARAQGGALIELQAYTPLARAQVIHNSADAVVSTVDVWLDNTKILDDFAFRSASPFLDVPANTQVTIAIKGADSQDPSNPLWSKSYTFTEDEKYILVAGGILSPTGYDPQKPFTVFDYEGALEQAAETTNTDVLVFHGVTDALLVDVVVVGDGIGTIVDDLDYGLFDGYMQLETGNYLLSVRDESGTTEVAYFETNFQDLNLQGKSLTLLASGFLDPTANNDGPAFGLLGVKADGSTVLFTNTLGIPEPSVNLTGLNVFPNPANDYFNVTFVMMSKGIVTVELIDIMGRKAAEHYFGELNAGKVNEKITLDGIQDGYYLLRINAGDDQVVRRLIIK